MKYAVRNDGLGWRAVESEDDCTAEEHFSNTQPVPPEPTIDDIAKYFTVAVQNELDDDAKQHGWDSINNAVAASGKLGYFMADADLYFKRWNDSWKHCFDELNKVKAGTRPLPTIDEIIAELPERISGPRVSA